MKAKKIFVLMVGTFLFSMTACSNSTIDIDNMPDVTVMPNPQPAKGQACIFTTTADGVHRLNQSSAEVKDGTNMAPTTLQIDPEKRYQSIDGFGFAITYSTCYNLLKMDPEARKEFLTLTYSPQNGYGASYARISIGCNDFSSKEYSLCDEEGLEHFALQTDETEYVIPILKEILAINPDLKIIAAPWTCPKWMKVSDIDTRAPYDSWTDGHLNPDYYDTYAQYFVKFVQAMKEHGINIYAVSPQNEPLNKGNCASLYMPWQEEAEFVKALASQFKRNSLQTQIYVYDHNYDYSGIADQDDYPIKIYNALGNNFEGSELVVGAAYHDYGGSNTELDDINAQAPDKSLIFSETSIGTWNNGRNLSERLMNDMKNIVLGTVNRQCKAVLVWNLMLDKNMGPNLDGGCQTCFGAVDIDPNGYGRLSYNSHYYVITHMSAVVKPGAVRIGTKRVPDNKDLLYSEFINPDGTYAAVIMNTGDSNVGLTIDDGTNHFSCDVPSNGVVSCRWNK